MLEKFNILCDNNNNLIKHGIIHLIPDKLKYLLNKKFIRYKNINLKTDYLINLIHNVLIKHLYRTNHNINLSSNILKKTYGQYYNYYLSYLLDNNILKIKNNYVVGKKSKTYNLNDSIIKDNINIYRINNKFLIKKLIKNNSDNYKKENYLINNDLRKKIINSLFNIKIDYDNCIKYINNLKNKNDLKNIYLKYNIECIKNGLIFYKFDDFGRLHTNFTLLKSNIRKKFILIDNENIVEIDNKNSQMLFLTKFIENNYSDIINTEEFNKFKELSYSGEFYDYIMKKYNIKTRKSVKKMTSYVICGINSINKKCDIIFSNEFPTIYEYIVNYKKSNKNYKILSYEIHKYEADFIFNNLIKEIYKKHPDINLFTIHDCIAVKKSLYNDILSIYNDVYKKTFK